MYLDYYHLKRKPFQINADPRFLWLGEKHKEALATLKYGIQDNKGFLLLTGDVGTGKTTMINALLNSLEEKIVVANIPDPALNRLEFYQYVAMSFGIERPIKNKVDFLRHFGQFLQAEADREQKVLLIIDEAQRLSHELLEEIRLLSNIERQKTKLLNIFFIGQNELNDILAESRNRALRQRITVNYHIRTLSEDEVAGYIRHRLLIAGSRKTLFNPDAVHQVYLFSGGYPRLINVICDRALLTGYVVEAKQINAKVVKECARELELPKRSSWLGTAKKRKDGAEGQDGREGEQPAGTADKDGGSRRWLAYGGVPALLAAGAAFAFFHSPGAQVFNEAEEDLAFEVGEQSSEIILGEPQQQPAAVTPLPETGQADQEQEISAPAAAAADAVSGIIEEPLPEETLTLEPLSAEPLFKKPSTENLPEQPLTEEPLLTASAVVGPARQDLLSVESGDNDFNQYQLDFMIHFPANSNELSLSSYQELDRLAAVLHRNTGIGALVTGYTDSSGVYQVNMQISESRANMVKGYLVGRGVDPDRIRTRGRGPEDPIASNDTIEGRRINRRVEIELTRELVSEQ